jgi:CPA2 family monovalent cation:H+ antiporter-2
VLAVVAAQILPFILKRLRSEHDLFLIVSVASGLAIAAAGGVFFGVPTALAAFVAGLAISDRAETAEARRRLLPFRDVFAVLFFVAVGTLIDPGTLPSAVPQILLLVTLVVVAKCLLAWVLVRLARLEARPLQLAIGLGQMGEFGYVLAGIGLAAGAVSGELFTAALATIVITIAGSAILVRLAGTAPASAAPAAPPGPTPPATPAG